METFDAITKRASVREYQAKPIDKKLLEKLVDAGRRAPTARAVEPWEFVVVQNRETLKKLGEIANTGSFIKDAACCIAVF
jgi:nitroreductase